jgi:hypothetical protein
MSGNPGNPPHFETFACPTWFAVAEYKWQLPVVSLNRK